MLESFALAEIEKKSSTLEKNAKFMMEHDAKYLASKGDMSMCVVLWFGGSKEKDKARDRAEVSSERRGREKEREMMRERER